MMDQNKSQQLNLPTLQQPTKEWWHDGLESYEVRKEMSKTLLGFGLVYFPHHLFIEPGIFHPEMVNDIGDASIEMLEILGFRGCTKSTWASLIYPIFAALVQPELFGFIVPISDTVSQSAMNIANIKEELENNELLRQDFGKLEFTKTNDVSLEDPTLESEEEWQSKNLLLSNGVRILARSRGQKLRGLKHRQFRPRLVVVDDPEDSKWVKTKENRDTTEKWWNAEVMGCLDLKYARVILLGNLLHTDALLARLEKRGVFSKVLKIPLFDKEEKCVWPAMYPDQASLDKKMKQLGPIIWQREMKLIPVPDEGQLVLPEHLHYYEKLPPDVEHGNTATGVDPAISKKATADCTAMVTGRGCYIEGKPRIYVMPDPLNLRLDVMETLEQAKALNQIYSGFLLFFVEDVAYQKALIQLMEADLLSVVPIKSLTDKRARLSVVLNFIKNGTVLFPATGCEELIQQLLGFGVEEHDDLVDAFVNMVMGLINNGLEMPEVQLIN